ncbi:allophanate hydrolase [Microbacterium sp. SORGH_AS_0888]|uniref:allophanate hydrolase n=1 Tax=Microbacterium sp. SORGH_AS_0888 TaxID=3041791 RepID=UPI002789CF33|nr:allophanate hydrolase [Microbacterium sp. SORGH_AS_0888]MDQ1130491.1 allophanate hydrolase [Microbacterium sp. SORGH_AS_0888]
MTAPDAAVAAVARAYRRIRESARPEVWIALRDEADALREARAVDDRAAAGERLPLAGATVAVKDNIDVAGLPTTVGLPSAAVVATVDAPAVARLRAAGAVVIGKTNLDQFATGLVGTRSPYGAVRGSRLPERISGGSSSGSAVAVALGQVDLALGTDTAGSGRVPAALNGLIGLKPTLGRIPTTGMRDACRPYDTITVFARSLGEAAHAYALMAGDDGADPRWRALPAHRRLAAPAEPVVVVPDASGLAVLPPASRGLWETAVERVAGFATVRPADVSVLLAAARLLYDGAIVAGRYAAAGRWLTPEHEAGLDPTVAGIVRGAAAPAAWRYVEDAERLDRARRAALRILAGADALLVPTAPRHPTLAEVAADPLGVNSEMGTYTNFVNLLDLAAVAVPAGSLGDEGEFGVSFVVRPFEDQIAVDLAARFLGQEPVDVDSEQEDGIDLAVFGAHLRGQPLHPQLQDLGARFLAEVRTAARYRLYALATTPPKPGLVRVDQAGAAIEGELWRLAPAALGRFLADLPAPMTLGPVELDDGRRVVGFGCEPAALTGAEDITADGGWRAALRRRATPHRAV